MTLAPSLALALVGAIAPLTAPPAAPSLQEPLQKPDAAQDYWADVARVLGERRGVRAVLAADPDEAALRARLAETKLPGLTLDEEESVTDIFALVQALSGLPIVVDARAENAAIDEGVVFDVNWSNPIAVEQVLDVITDLAGEWVDWTVRGGVVLVTSAEHALEAREIYLHPIADLLGTFEADEASAMVQENIFAGTWEHDGVAIQPTGAFLLVVHTRETQLAVEAFLSDLRTFQASLSAPPTYGPGEAEVVHAAQLARLDAVRFAPRFGADGDGNGVPLTAVAAYLQDLTGMNFAVGRRVVEGLDEDDFKIRLDLPETSVRDVLDLIVETRDSLRWTVEGNLVRFSLVDEEREDAVFALYDVRDIVSPADPAHVGGFGVGGDELEALVLPSDLLEDLIRNEIDPDSWDWSPSYAMRVTETGIMMVAQSPVAQARVRALLADLHEIARVLLEVREKHERGR